MYATEVLPDKITELLTLLSFPYFSPFLWCFQKLFILLYQQDVIRYYSTSQGAKSLLAKALAYKCFSLRHFRPNYTICNVKLQD